MVRVVGIDHLAIRVSDLARSRQFYDRLLTFMGFVREWEFGEVVGWNNWQTMFWITQADAEGLKHPYREGGIGYHHYAFELESAEQVDELYAFMRDAFMSDEGVDIVDPPAAYPSYGDGYYAVFFRDPDGLKLEAMYFAEKTKRRARLAAGGEP